MCTGVQKGCTSAQCTKTLLIAFSHIDELICNLYLLIFGDLSPDKQSSRTSYFVKSPQCVFEGKIKITIMQTFSHSLKDAGVNQGSNKNSLSSCIMGNKCSFQKFWSFDNTRAKS